MIVVRIRTAVVLPAPFGPSSPNTVPCGTSKSTPSRATTCPNRLARSSTTTAPSAITASSHPQLRCRDPLPEDEVALPLRCTRRVVQPVGLFEILHGQQHRRPYGDQVANHRP